MNARAIQNWHFEFQPKLDGKGRRRAWHLRERLLFGQFYLNNPKDDKDWDLGGNSNSTDFKSRTLRAGITCNIDGHHFINVKNCVANQSSLRINRWYPDVLPSWIDWQNEMTSAHCCWLVHDAPHFPSSGSGSSITRITVETPPTMNITVGEHSRSLRAPHQNHVHCYRPSKSTTITLSSFDCIVDLIQWTAAVS